MTARALLLLLALLTPLAPAASAQDPAHWPREIRTAEGGTITIYQPQFEKLAGVQLTARAAVSYKGTSTPSPVFGTAWFSSLVDTDRDAKLVVIRALTVTNVRWPGSTPERATRFSQIVEADLAKTTFRMALPQFTAALATAEQEHKSLQSLKNDPPKIVFSEQVAILLLYDGAPMVRPIEGSDLRRAVNTPFAVVQDISGLYYLSGGKIWYSASDPKGPWVPTKPPAKVAQMVPPDTSSAPAPQVPPKIVAATEPTELIVSDGPPKWKSLPGGKLYFVENSESAWIRDVATRDQYLLLAGRWFRSKATTGPWTFVRPDSLPPAFKDIPAETDIGRVRASIAGTPEAEEAMLDLAVPQTAAIHRTATLTVKYDGEPQFKPIEGTSVEYAINTATQVLRIDGRYYAVDQGVWFVSGLATGPWVVADRIPQDQIKTIPPSSPVYNATQVEIFDSTPEVVYVGYYPGYTGSYPVYGVPVYGTGWYYPPPPVPVYYPHPVTYGMAVSYNPWTGWGVGFSWGVGFLTVGIGFGGYPPYHGGFYPPYGYRPPYYHPYPPGGYRPPGGYPGGRPRPTPYGDNAYNGAGNRGRVASTLPAQSGPAARSSTQPNNVYASPAGDVYRKTPSGWEQNGKSGWQKPSGAAPSNLNRDAQARASGASRSMGARPRGGGGRRR